MQNGSNKNRRSIGVNFLPDGQAHIRVWAPLCESVELFLKDKNKKIPLQKEEDGYWQEYTNEIKIGNAYKFIVDGKELPDPASLAQPQGVHGTSAAIDITQFNWTDFTWNNIPLPDYILYELHTGTFSPDGTFKGIEEKLDHLVELGITAIEIMPVAQFAGSRNWGYDGVYPFAVQHSYGAAEGLQQLVNACHQKGLAVVLDVVYNHLGPEGNYLGEWGPYFTDKYKTPWGSALNFDDEWCDGIRSYFIENVLMWFRDFHIDALRLDAVHAIKDFSAVHILQQIKTEVDALMQATGKTHFLIVESDLNDTRFINPASKGGYGMDAQWIDEFHHALRVAAGGEKTGYYADFDGPEHLAKAYKDAYVYDGQYSPHRKKKFGIKATENKGHQFVVFSQNHDQVGNRMLGERTSTLVSFEMQKLLAGAVMVSPFLPMLFMGEEWAEPAPFQYFVSHTDPHLAEAVRKGRKAEFAAFHLGDEAPDPMAEETFNNSKLSWHLTEQEPYKTMLSYYKALLQLRKQQPLLRLPDRSSVSVKTTPEKSVLMLEREGNNEVLLILMNFSKKEQHFDATGQNLTVQIFNSALSTWGGPAENIDQNAGSSNLILYPESISIYTTQHV